MPTKLAYSTNLNATNHSISKVNNATEEKKSKDRVSLMLAANMDGTEQLKPLLIGKFPNPRCFKNIKSLPVVYKKKQTGMDHR